MTINPELTEKQKEIYRYLVDDITTEILGGGGAGGSKSTIGSIWLIISAIKYPGTRWLMGRSVLKSLKDTTLVTFFDWCGKFGLLAGIHYDFNTKDNYIKFKPNYGGSIILLKDLFQYPSDTEFDSLGSLEITGAFIDEVNQCVEKAKNIVNSRIRYKLNEFCICGHKTNDSKVLETDPVTKMAVRWLCVGCGEETEGLIPKLFMSCNPAKNWTYSQFYRPFRDGNLPEYRRFVQMLAKDNPFISPHYVDNLKKLDPASKERLLYGNWEYDDDDTVLMEYEAILNMFSNDLPDGNTYISCDYARFGKDKTVILVWSGWKVIDYKQMARSDMGQAAVVIRKFMVEYAVPSNRVVVDEQGTGSGLVDLLGCRGFVASAQPVYVHGMKEVYQNLKAQCSYRFAEKVNNGEVYFFTDDITVRETIVEEMEQIRRKDPDKEGKLNTEGKDMIREAIGRSPDWWDALYMRVLLDLKTGKRYLI